MKRRWLVLVAVLAGMVWLAVPMSVFSQDAGGAAPAPAAAETQTGNLTVEGEAPPEESSSSGMGFVTVIISSGWMGVVLWLGLFGCSIAGVWLMIDYFVKIQEKKIVPATLVTKVREAMEQGDVMKALTQCESEPGPLANILSAGFSNVEEGFETVQDAIGVAAELETERLMQRINYLNVVSNLAPMLGLLGTVQGMIYAFATLATSAGAAKQALLALNIAQALYTTAAGLLVAIPAVAFYFYFKNRATNIILGMEMLTLDLVKNLRNVEVVET